jgi:hypothetical protein
LRTRQALTSMTFQHLKMIKHQMFGRAGLPLLRR